MDEAECRARLSSARVGRLATVRPDGGPHVVACCFAVQGDRLWTAVDAKPKTTARLQRLDNIRAHPRAIQRPIITAADGTTVIGRDPDSVAQAIEHEAG